jgi:hypothetical protein
MALLVETALGVVLELLGPSIPHDGGVVLSWLGSKLGVDGKMPDGEMGAHRKAL